MYEQFHEWLLTLTPDQLVLLGCGLVFLCGFVLGRLSKRRNTEHSFKHQRRSLITSLERRAAAMGAGHYYIIQSTDDVDELAEKTFDGDYPDYGETVFLWTNHTKNPTP